MNRQQLLEDACRRASNYLNEIGDRRVFPSQREQQLLQHFDEPLPDQPQSESETLERLDRFGSPCTVASTGGRYFGFVTGGALPATVAAKWLTTAWDQNSALQKTSPIVGKLESIAARWLIQLLGLPESSGTGFVSGATMGNFTGLAAARHSVLQRLGWDVNADGLFGAPEIQVIIGGEAHASLRKALMLLGLGHSRVTEVPVDSQGRMRADALPPLSDRCIVCLQAGNVNSGAIDPAAIITEAKQAGAWVHVDGAFGLWTMAVPEFEEITAGYELADSWVVDAHKWLNTPYDGGIVFARDAATLKTAMNLGAAYLQVDDQRQPSHFVPEFSRRARGVEIWAALRTLGRNGLIDLVRRNCHQARLMAELLEQQGLVVRNEVVLNQVVVASGDQQATNQILAAIEEDGTTWCGGTFWQGQPSLRISVSSWATTDDDIRRSAAAIARIVKANS